MAKPKGLSFYIFLFLQILFLIYLATVLLGHSHQMIYIDERLLLWPGKTKSLSPGGKISSHKASHTISAILGNNIFKVESR